MLLQALMKPPGTGEKRWHQDQGYFRLRPSQVAAYWIALDDVDIENGCMVQSTSLALSRAVYLSRSLSLSLALCPSLSLSHSLKGIS